MRVFLLFFLYLCQAIAVAGQQPHITVGKYEHLMGSAQVIEDKNGNIWSWSESSIYRLTPYKQELIGRIGKYPVFVGKRMLRFFEDNNGMIWIMYGDPYAFHGVGGYEIQFLDILDPVQKTITPIQDYFGKELPVVVADIFHIAQDQDGQLWVGTKDGRLYNYDRQFKFQLSLESQQAIGHVHPASAGSLWIDTHGGFQKIDRKSGAILEKFQMEGVVQRIKINEDHTFWILSMDEREQRHVFIKYPKQDPVEFPLPDYIHDLRITIFFGERQQVWVATEYFFLLWDPECNTITDLTKEVYSIVGGKRNVFQIYVRPNRQTWLCGNGTLSFINIITSPFSNYTAGQNFSLRGITSYNDSLIWINSYDGLYLLHKKTGELSRLPIAQKQGRAKLTPLNKIFGRAIVQDSKQNMWLGTDDVHLLHYEHNTQILSTRTYPLHGLYRVCNSPFIDQSGTLWIGMSHGLLYLDQQQDQLVDFEQYNEFGSFRMRFVQYIMENRQGIWLATDQGLYLLKPGQGLIAHHYNFPSNDIVHILEDPEGIFWLSTRGAGLIRWDTQTNDILPVSMGEGMEENQVHAAYADDYGFLWVPTNNGLKRVNKTTLSIQTFTVEHGLPDNEFNYLAHYQDTDGKLYFGGVAGLSCFHPKDLSQEAPNQSPLNLESYQLLDQNGVWQSSKLPRKMTEGLTISASAKGFKLAFALMEFGPPQALSYSYQLAGYDQDWRHTTAPNLEYGRLPFGQYTLKIRGKSAGKGWSQHELLLPVNVLKPYYLQVWFVLLALALVSSIIFGLVRWRFIFLEKEKIKLEQMVSERTDELQRLHQVKNELFAIIGHDLRGPVISMAGMGDKIRYLMQKDQPDLLLKVGSDIESRVKNLRLLIDNLLAWSLSQDGELSTMNRSWLFVSEVVEEQIDLLRDQATYKDQKIIFEEKENIHCYSIKLILGTLIRNLLFNSIRHSQAGTQIHLRIETFQQIPCLTIEDQGPGMPDHLRTLLNEGKPLAPHFQQVDKEGLGVGLRICSSLLNSLGGNWYFEPGDQGRGLKVRLWFPQAQFKRES